MKHFKSGASTYTISRNVSEKRIRQNQSTLLETKSLEVATILSFNSTIKDTPASLILPPSLMLPQTMTKSETLAHI